MRDAIKGLFQNVRGRIGGAQIVRAHTGVKTPCWELKRCERGPGGALVAEQGLCPAAEATFYNGTNNGLNGSRICWKISGTKCDTGKPGDFMDKVRRCMKCNVFLSVRHEEGDDFSLGL